MKMVDRIYRTVRERKNLQRECRGLGRDGFIAIDNGIKELNDHFRLILEHGDEKRGSKKK